MSDLIEGLGRFVRWSWGIIAALGALALVIIILVGISWLAATIPGAFMELIK